jgi:hypothetical protein
MPLSDVLDFSQIVGQATVRQGGHGLGAVPEGHILVGTGRDVMRTVPSSELAGKQGQVLASSILGRLALSQLPPSNRDDRYFLGSTADGRGVIWKIPSVEAGAVSWSNISGKPGTFPPTIHGNDRHDPNFATEAAFDAHVADGTIHFTMGAISIDRSQVSDFFGAPFWASIPDTPATFPPEAHVHDADDITTGALAKARQHAQTAYRDENNAFSTFQEIHRGAGTEFLILRAVQDSATTWELRSSDFNAFEVRVPTTIRWRALAAHSEIRHPLAVDRGSSAPAGGLSLDVGGASRIRGNLELDGTMNTGTVPWARLSDIPAFASRWPTWGEVTSKPSTFPPESHSHPYTDLTYSGLTVGHVLTATGATSAAFQAPAGGGAVDSVFGRTGAVVAESDDYDFPKISGNLAYGQLPSGSGTWVGSPGILPAGSSNHLLRLTANLGSDPAGVPTIYTTDGSGANIHARFGALVFASRASSPSGEIGFITGSGGTRGLRGRINVDGVWILGPGDSPGNAEAGGIRATGFSHLQGLWSSGDITTRLAGGGSFIARGDQATNGEMIGQLAFYQERTSGIVGSIKCNRHNSDFSSSLDFYTRSGSSEAFRMRLRMLGELLLGTTAPGNTGAGGIRATGHSHLASLEVDGDLEVGGKLHFDTTATAGDPHVQRAGSALWVGTTTNDAINYVTNGVRRFRMLGAGDTVVVNRMSVDRGDVGSVTAGLSLDVGGDVLVDGDLEATRLDLNAGASAGNRSILTNSAFLGHWRFNRGGDLGDITMSNPLATGNQGICLTLEGNGGSLGNNTRLHWAWNGSRAVLTPWDASALPDLGTSTRRWNDAFFAGEVEAEGGFFDTSRLELKKNVKALRDSLDPEAELDALLPSTWSWKKDGKEDMGLIADWTAPRYLNECGTAVNWKRVVTVLLDVVKRQQERLIVLEATA